MEKALTGAVAVASLDEIRPFIELALKYEGSGVMCVDDFKGMKLFKCLDGEGNIVAGYALAVATFIHAKVVWIMAAAGKDKRIDILRSYLPVIHQQARDMGAAQVQILTVRPGLMRRMQKAGYEGLGQVFRINL